MSRPLRPLATHEARISLLAITVLAPLAGALAGFVGALFRMVLDRADAIRALAILAAHATLPFGPPLLIAAITGLVAFAAYLVARFSREASGSGIPHVEAVLDGAAKPGTARLLPVKFVGGALAIGSGLALGREGPSVQMGATLAHLVGRWCRASEADCRMLLAAGAGAGLATAFNAPIAGAVFVLEELVKRFETRIAIAALGASATAIAVVRLMLGDGLIFEVPAIATPPVSSLPAFVLLGAASGLAAVAYNRGLLATMTLFERASGLHPVLRAAMVGLAVGIVAFVAPGVVGGGDSLTQSALSGEGTIGTLVLLFALRFLLGAASYAAGTPGGLFAPMLVLGAQLGLACGFVAATLFAGLDLDPNGFALVGMAAFFVGVVRAPLTGIVLVVEMTSNTTLLVPMLSASFIAMLVPTMIGNPPIYDSLRERAAEATRSAGPRD